MVYKVTEETINGIANAIRTKTNSDEEMQVQDFAAEILNIETGENTASAAQSAKNAEASAISAASNAQFAKESAELAAEIINNAYIDVDAAAASAESAASSVNTIKESEEKIKKNLDYTIDMIQNLEGFNSEAWAVGTRNGVAVDSNDVTYQNNSKHWSDVARDTVVDFQSKLDLINVFATAAVLEEE